MADADASADHRSWDVADLLTAAVERSGMSVSDVTRHLRDHGHIVTDAAFAQWCAGDRLPSLHRDLAVLPVLEEILGIAPGTLVDLVTTLHELSGRDRQAPLGEGADQLAETFERLRRALGVTQWPVYRVVMVREEIHLDETGTRRYDTEHLLIESLVDGLTSMVLGAVDGMAVDGPGTTEVLGERRIGAVAVDREQRMTVVRIDLPRPLARGETAAVSVRTHYPFAGGRAYVHERWSQYAMREHTMEIVFHPDLPAGRVDSFTSPIAHAPLNTMPLRTCTVGEGLARAVHVHVPPGASGVRWQYADGIVKDVDDEDADERPLSERILAAWRDVRPENEVPVPPPAESGIDERASGPATSPDGDARPGHGRRPRPSSS